MIIGIHYQPGHNFSPYWKEYCEKNNIPHKVVNCYANDIIQQLKGCSAFMWHINNYDYRDQIFAKFVFKVAEQMGLKTFPKYDDIWHYDDKLAQKYYLEAIGAPLIRTYVFYDKNRALRWVERTNFPKVFKLRKGSGSTNVILVKSKWHAKRLIKKMFNKGIKPLNMWERFKERWRKYKLGKESFVGIIKAVTRLFIGTPYLSMSTREKGYVYFQDFIPNLDCDYRVKVVSDKCWGYQRPVRKGDFRASGTVSETYASKEDFKNPEQAIPKTLRDFAFNISKELKMSTCAFDFLLDNNGKVYLAEITSLYGYQTIQHLSGYWDDKGCWHAGEFNPFGWMVESVLQESIYNSNKGLCK